MVGKGRSRAQRHDQDADEDIGSDLTAAGPGRLLMMGARKKKLKILTGPERFRMNFAIADDG
jgi:hypothetical protein